MATVNPRRSRNDFPGGVVDSNIEFRCHPKGGSGGDMTLADAIEWVNRNNRCESMSVQGAFFKEQPTVTLNLLPGEHEVLAKHARIQNVEYNLTILGPDLAADGDDPQATVMTQYGLEFYGCTKVDMNNMDLNGSLAIYRGTSLSISWHAGTTGRTFRHVNGYLTVGDGCFAQISHGHNQLTKVVSFGAAVISGVTFDGAEDSLKTTSRPIILALRGGDVVADNLTFTTASIAPGHGQIIGTYESALICASQGRISIDDNLSIPSGLVAGNSVVFGANRLGIVHVGGNVNLNGHANPGLAPSTQYGAAGGMLLVGGTYTP